MNPVTSFNDFAPQLRAFMARAFVMEETDAEFNRLSAALFSLQTRAVPIYQQFCAKRKVFAVENWREIPALPAVAFKEYEVTSLPDAERPHVFHSSGTTQHVPGKHFHNEASLGIYEDSVRGWFHQQFVPPLSSAIHPRFLFLTPSPALAPHSSLAHMFGVIHREFPDSLFLGGVDPQGAWTLDLAQTLAALHQAQASNQPAALLGTAFSFVHLLDHCRDSGTKFHLAPGSRVMETGGYKGRSRVVAKMELRRLMTKSLGVPAPRILSEYGMSELSSQAYDHPGGHFYFPPWARVQITSPETGREVAEGETGMIRVFDLANVRSVMALQTEDLAVRHGDGFELIGRAAHAEPRGCSRMFEDS